MKLLLALAAFAASAPTHAAKDDPFCDDIRTLAAAAGEADPFRSLRDRNFRPRLLRGYCFFSAAGGYTCGQNLSRPDETARAYAGRIASCLDGAAVERSGRGFERSHVVRAGSFEARISERGTDRGHVGRSINIYVASLRRAGE